MGDLTDLEGFAFDVSSYHVGLNPDKEFRFDPRIEDRVRAVPGEVWRRVEQLYTIGMVTSYKHLRAVVANITPHNVEEDVLKYYLTKHAVRLSEKRRLYLSEVESKAPDPTNMSPEEVRSQRLQIGMSILIEGHLMKALHGEAEMTVQDMSRMAKMIREYTGMEGVIQDGKSSDRPQTGHQMSSRTDQDAKASIKAIMDHNELVGGQEDLIADEFEARSNRVLDKEAHTDERPATRRE